MDHSIINHGVQAGRKRVIFTECQARRDFEGDIYGVQARRDFEGSSRNQFVRKNLHIYPCDPEMEAPGPSGFRAPIFQIDCSSASPDTAVLTAVSLLVLRLCATSTAIRLRENADNDLGILSE